MYAEKTRLKRVKIAQQRTVESIPPRFFMSLVRQLGRKYDVAYTGSKCFRFAGQDLTHEEFLKRSQGVIDQHINDSGMKRAMRDEAQAAAQRQYHMERMICNIIRRAGVGFPQLWGHDTDEANQAKIYAWVEQIKQGGNPQQLKRVQSLVTQLNEALELNGHE